MKKIVLLLLSFTIYGCTIFAESFAPVKKPTAFANATESSKTANRFFWDQFHQGNYDSIPQIQELLSQSYFNNSRDLPTVAHLGFVNIWSLSERTRNGENEVANTPLRNIQDSQLYFEEAAKMSPHDPRLLGFGALSKMTLGSVANNKKMVRDGFFDGKQSINAWPQFNKFTVGYFFSGDKYTSNRFEQSLDDQLSTLDDCFCENIDEDTYDFIGNLEKIKNSSDPKIYRTCWNSWIAPHNWEGFCMNLGDMLVKSGDAEKAVRMYNLALLSDTYNDWPFKNELQDRIANARDNIDLFRNGTKKMMAGTDYSCMACHQMSESEFTERGHVELTEAYYFLK